MSEYGDPGNATDFPYLLAASPLDNVSVPNGTGQYPAVMVSTGAHPCAMRLSLLSSAVGGLSAGQCVRAQRHRPVPGCDGVRGCAPVCMRARARQAVLVLLRGVCLPCTLHEGLHACQRERAR